MDKKIIGIIIAVVVIVALGISSFVLLGDKKADNNSNGETKETDNDKTIENTDDTSNDKQGDKKVLVVYFSATNNTKNVAEKIAKNLNGTLFEIVPEDEYTSEDLNYNNSNSRVSKEHEDESLRDMKLQKTTPDDWASYDTILIGYPIWWGVAAWPVDAFVKANDFEGKTIIPFATSASSGLGQSGKLLENEANGGNWLEGKRFSSRPNDADIASFTDSIK